MAGKIFHYEFVVLETHLDTFGHVNHATYLVLFEQARWDFITANGFGLKEVQAGQHGPIILGVTLQYRKELKLRERVTIESQALDFSGRIGKMSQRMINSQGELACSADLSVGYFDLANRRLQSPPKEWIRAIGLELPSSMHSS